MALIEKMQQHASANDCPSVVRTLVQIERRPAFTRLVEEARAPLFRLHMVCAWQNKNQKAAYRAAVAGTELAGATPDLWRARLGVEQQEKRDDAAIATVVAMARKDPEALNAIPIRWLHALNRTSRDRGLSEQRRALLAILSSPTYNPDEATADNDAFRQDYAALLLDEGDRPAAAALVADIDNPSVLMKMSVDPRLREFLPPDFDGRAAVERRLVKAREIAVSHAGSLEAALDVVILLRQLGRLDEALATLKAARPDGKQGDEFADGIERLNWWWDEMARSYLLLGRYEDAVAAFRTGIAAKESGGANISQTLNLAEAQLRFGHPADAIATADKIVASDGASPYGLMVQRDIRGCARYKLGQTVAARADLDYVYAHERDRPETAITLALCAGDIAGAARTVARQLDDPQLRPSTLLLLSDYDTPPQTFPRAPYAAALAALKSRPDVQDAIRRAGGTRRFHLQDDT